MRTKLPKQVCPLGYTDAELKKILGKRAAGFSAWMRGQTVGLCDGRTYDHETRSYRDNGCTGKNHGVVVYRWDVERFLAGELW